jgi:hypothetical protein
MITEKVKTREDLKVGDKVILVGNKAASRNHIGDIGVVKHIEKYSAQIEVEDRPDGDKEMGNYQVFSDLEKIINEVETEIVDTVGDISEGAREVVSDAEEFVEDTHKEVVGWWSRMKARWKAFVDLWRDEDKGY